MVLAERRDKTVWPDLRAMAKQTDNPRLALQGLWALHVTGGLDAELAGELLRHPEEYVRAWTVRLLGDANAVSPAVAARFAELAATDAYPAVQAQLACTAKRLPGAQGLPVVERLLTRDTDAGDPVIPWLVWWAVESKAMSDRDRVTAFFASAENRTSGLVKATLGRVIRRYAADGSAVGYQSAHTLLSSLTPDERAAVLPDFDKGLAERAVGLPGVGQGGCSTRPPSRPPIRRSRCGSTSRSPRSWPRSSPPRGSSSRPTRREPGSPSGPTSARPGPGA